jgi:hypothetical protein
VSHIRHFLSALRSGLEADREAHELLRLEKKGVGWFKVIEGGLYGAAAPDTGADQVSKLRVEGQRRLQQAGLEGFGARERLTGIAIPSSGRFFKLQIDLQSMFCGSCRHYRPII